MVEYIFKTCDSCNIQLGLSEFTIFEEHDTQLFVCEDCYNIEEL